MKTQKIDGISIISENGDFYFDSGLPESEQVVENPQKQQGTAVLMKNGCFEFKAKNPTPVGTPSMETILKAEGLIVKRSAKNFLVTMKFPIFEKASETKTSHTNFWQQAEPVIASERKKIKTTF